MARLQNPTSTIKVSDDDEVQARSLRALQDQLEALGVGRRERLSEDDFPENRRATLRASALEATRRINLEGTTESRVSDDVKGLLSSWSNAWTALANDEAARENLTDINAGQTHRASLAFKVSEQQFDKSADVHNVGHGDARYRGSDRARGGGRGGRGGGHAGSRRSRHGPTRVPVGLEPIDEVAASRATNGNMTISGGRRRVSPSIDPQITNERSLRGRSIGDLIRADARRAISTLPTRPRPDLELHATSTAKAEQEPTVSSVSRTVRRVPLNAFNSLADPDTFMAVAGRKATTKTPSSKATSVTSSHDNAAKTAKSSQGASSVSQDLIMLDPLDTSFRALEKSTPPGTRKAIVPDLLSTANSQTGIDVMNPVDSATAQPPKKVNPPVQAADALENASVEAQQEVDQDRENLRRLREFVGQEGGTFKADMLSLIETLEAKLSSRLRADSKRSNTDETTVLADDTLSTQAKVTATPSIRITAVKHKTVKIGSIFGENIYRNRYDARSRADSVASSVASTAEDIRSVSASFSQLSLQPRDSQWSTPSVQPAPVTPSLTVSAPKSPASDQSIVTANLTMRQSPRPVDNAIARQYSSQTPEPPRAAVIQQPSISNLDLTTVVSARTASETVGVVSSLGKNDISRQSSVGDATGHEPRYASSNPFAGKQTSSESFRGSGGGPSEQKDSSSRQHTSEFAKRFNNAPYRRDEGFASTDRPKLPDFLKELSSDGQDTGAAARRQYGGASDYKSQSDILTERVSRQITPFPATSQGSDFSNTLASITASNPGIRPPRGATTSENVRSETKKDSLGTAQHTPW